MKKEEPSQKEIFKKNNIFKKIYLFFDNLNKYLKFPDTECLIMCIVLSSLFLIIFLGSLSISEYNSKKRLENIEAREILTKDYNYLFKISENDEYVRNLISSYMDEGKVTYKEAWDIKDKIDEYKKEKIKNDLSKSN